MEEKGNSLLGCLGGLYAVVSQIMALVFFVEYCKKDSILEIIFLDTWISELKGLFWIFFIW